MTLDCNRDYSRIKKFRDKNVYNIGKSVEVIKEQIAAILNGDL